MRSLFKQQGSETMRFQIHVLLMRSHVIFWVTDINLSSLWKKSFKIQKRKFPVMLWREIAHSFCYSMERHNLAIEPTPNIQKLLQVNSEFLIPLLLCDDTTFFLLLSR